VGVWRTANGIRPGRRTEQQAIEERGERGSRIGDLVYSDKYLELGMLKGNNFAITLRYVCLSHPVEFERMGEANRSGASNPKLREKKSKLTFSISEPKVS
jgi:tRNA pseudouridine13 synthase